MIHFLRDIKSKTEHYSGHAQSIVARVQAIIERDYSNSALSIVQIAEQLYISSSHLSTVFKKKTGKPFSQYLKEIRLKKASELMKEDRLKIYEIAASVGYLNEKSFSRAFRRELGVSPQNYKRESGLL
ncbi:helix-turn-helix domain-containing protein [Paenibacillus chungangensis]|uniref:Helix-turn-helix domain-containing protein n=1 Tax=Paenibacillus chungangensis TaxID=696535 RepID=A0ABW3HPB0_9BACL